MITDRPIRLAYLGEGKFEATGPRTVRDCESMFGAGEIVALTRHEDRSMNSHRHYFSCIGEAWRNLPDHMLDEFPSAEHLRKKALVRAGYADERTFVCASKAEAARMAAFLRPMDEYAIVSVREATVTVWTAKSQSVRAMGNAEFQASKEAVLDVISRLIGVSTDDLRQNTGKAA